MKKLLSVILIGLLLGGCAAGPRFNPAELELRSDMATVYFYRPWAWGGGAGTIDIIANGVKVGALKNGAQFKRFLQPGTYKFHSRNAMVIDRVTTIKLHPRQITYIKGYYASGMWVTSARIEAVYPEQAIDEISNL